MVAEVGPVARDPQLYPELLLYPLIGSVVGAAVVLVAGHLLPGSRRAATIGHAVLLGYVAAAVLMIGILPDSAPLVADGRPQHPVDLVPFSDLLPPPSADTGWATLLRQFVVRRRAGTRRREPTPDDTQPIRE